MEIISYDCFKYNKMPKLKLSLYSQVYKGAPLSYQVKR